MSAARDYVRTMFEAGAMGYRYRGVAMGGIRISTEETRSDALNYDGSSLLPGTDVVKRNLHWLERSLAVVNGAVIVTIQRHIERQPSHIGISIRSS